MYASAKCAIACFRFHFRVHDEHCLRGSQYTMRVKDWRQDSMQLTVNNCCTII